MHELDNTGSLQSLSHLGHSPIQSERSEREGREDDEEEEDDEEDDDEDDDDDDDEEATETEPEGFSDDSIVHVSFDNGKDDSRSSAEMMNYRCNPIPVSLSL